ncbi:MAG: efflux RND transporter periplasmic adaptor subunit [Burkholderiales bacterium]|nr:efflux RND transporter periplasmic adaptor subunit [Burkholderiales bacterium]
MAITVAVTGVVSRLHHDKELHKELVRANIDTVNVVHPQYGPSMQELILPGNVTAYIDAPIYARVNGYLKTWYTDIGARVKKGELLGIIETPELDEEIMRARATLATAQSNLELANITAKRWQNLLVSDSVSRQSVDEKTADAKAKQDLVNAAKANLETLLAQQAFNRVVSPFDGVVTERNTDIGKLINLGSNSGQALFRVADIHKLRIYVDVPQSYASLIQEKMKAKLYFPEHPGKAYTATLTSTANAVRVASRTMAVELQMDNQNGEVLPGTYAEVHFEMPSRSNVFMIPASTLLFRKEGLQVAIVGPDNKVILKHIVIGRDLGRIEEVINGLDANDKIIDSPSDSIAQGEVVRVKSDQHGAKS